MTMTQIWREPFRGGYGDPSMLGLAGIDQLRSGLTGYGVRPPVSRLTGQLFESVEPGSAVFTMPATSWLAGPSGNVHPGMLAFLADAPLACAIQSQLPPATPYTTAELSMTFLRPVRADGRTITARSRSIALTGSSGLSEIMVTDADGQLCAHGTTRCFIMPAVDPAPEPRWVPMTEPVYDTPDPYERPVVGGVLDEGAAATTSGRDLLQGQIEGAIPLPPIHHLTGITPVAADQGSATFTMPATEWLNGPWGIVYGGAIGFLAKSAVSAAAQTLAPAGTRYAALDVKVNFLRPVLADGRDLTARGVVSHGGRSLVVATAQVEDADGRVVALASGSTSLTRPPALGE